MREIVTEMELESALREWEHEEKTVLDSLFLNLTFLKDLSGFDFKNCIFNRCAFGTQFRSAFIWDCSFIGCDLAGVSLDGCSIQNSRFENCRLTGTSWIKTYFSNVHFLHTKAEYANFSHAALRNTAFESCELRQVSFSQNKCRNLCFVQCDLDRASFFQTPLCGVELSDSEISGLCADVNSLKGVIINEQQAVELIKLFGIAIKEGIL